MAVVLQKAAGMSVAPAFAWERTVGLAYGDDPAQVLDIYPACGSGLHRLVIFVHGGGWVSGTRQAGRNLAGPLNRAGYTLASLDYRLVPQTDIAGSASDIASAVRFLLNNAKHFGFAPERFALTGHSAGAHLVALLGTDQNYLRRAGVDVHRLAAVVALDGIYDLTVKLGVHQAAVRAAVFGGDPVLWQRYSPASHVANMQARPRMCLLHEDIEPRYAVQSGLFQAALRVEGLEAETATAPGIGHGQLVGQFDSNKPMATFMLDCLGRAF